MKDLKLSYRMFFALSGVYIILPLLIFFVAFTKVYWAIILSLVFAGSLALACRSIDKSKSIKLSVPYLAVLLTVCLLWAYIAGIGEFSWTTMDHTARYAIMNDLVEYDWPVFYDLGEQSNPAVRQILGSSDTVAFAYYFFFWLVPALFGKLFGLTAGRVALVIWSAIGLNLIILSLNFLQKKPSVTALILFFAFGGFDIVMYVIQEFILDTSSAFEGWNTEFYVHGNLYQTMNTFNQAIPCWLLTSLLLSFPNKKHIGFISSLTFCYSPWATFGILPIAICQLVKDKEGHRLKNILTPGNIVVPAAVLAVFGTFFTANAGATGDKGFIWEFFGGDYIFMLKCYLLYVIIEFGVWSLIVFKDQKRNPVFWTAVITLLVMPVWKMTEANDFLMRGTIAPIFVITLYVLYKLDDSIAAVKKNGNDLKAVGVIAAVLVAGLTPLMLLLASVGLTRQIYQGTYEDTLPKDYIVSFGDIADENFTEVTRRQVYVYDYKTRPFYRIFGK